jgi:hypothetical protein
MALVIRFPARAAAFAAILVIAPLAARADDGADAAALEAKWKDADAKATAAEKAAAKGRRKADVEKARGLRDEVIAAREALYRKKRAALVASWSAADAQARDLAAKLEAAEARSRDAGISFDANLETLRHNARIAKTNVDTIGSNLHSLDLERVLALEKDARDAKDEADFSGDKTARERAERLRLTAQKAREELGP